MSAVTIEDDDDDSSTSPSVSDAEDEGSTLGSTQGSLSLDDSRSLDDSQRSMDSISPILRRLEDNDANLVELDVDIASTDAEEARCISVVLPENTRLQRLRLDCGNDPSRSDIVRKVVSGLRGNTSVRKVEIHNLTMDRDTSGWMAQSLANGRSINHICMTKCRFIGSGVGTLFVAMQHMKQLRHLSFYQCDWDDHNTEIVATSLPFLKLLSLSLVGINVAVDSWSFLFNNIRRSKGLILLDLSSNDVDDAVIGLLTKAIVHQKSISTLVLSSCGLDDNCAKELAKGLKEYSTLTSLDISNNSMMGSKGVVHLTRRGVVHLRELMKVNNSITEMKVNGCGLDQRSLNIIEGCLRYNNSPLKSFLSEDASQKIFDVVDKIEKFDIGESTRNIVQAVSFRPVKFDISESTRNIVQAVSFSSAGSGAPSTDSPPRGEATTPKRVTRRVTRRVTPRAQQAVRYTMKEPTQSRGPRDVFL